ncbi:MAG: ParB N-terminal domain-containing protein, partial [Caulobacteraceae bacterium]
MARGLGRGLSALLDDASDGDPPGGPGEGVREIPIELVHRNPEQPRRHFPDEEIAELEASIRDKGVLQPI